MPFQIIRNDITRVTADAGEWSAGICLQINYEKDCQHYVVRVLRRHSLLQFHVHRYRMSLISADLRHVLIESIALLIISADDLLQIGHGNVMFSGSVDAIDQIRC